MSKTLEDFSRWYCRHTGVWKWREKKIDPQAVELGHQSEGEARTKNLMTAGIQLELQRRREAERSAAEAAEPILPAAGS